MPRHAFAQLSKLSDCIGRIDYISNPDRQEHLITTYSTHTDELFWMKLADTCHKEHDKYGAEGKAVEAREWIIALEESLLEFNPDMVLRKFVDAFHEKYGVECTAALHQNHTQTNYHIHMIFSERKLLEEPIEKTATRNMFFDEHGKHRRTKKEILDAEGNVRPGCKIIAKGEVYESQIFSGKDSYFKSVAFRKEAQELFKNINNSLISNEDRKLSIFNPDSVYLATKKVGKNNPMAEFILADNDVRKEWNRSVDQALIAMVDREEILDVKQNAIQEKIRESIAENGPTPGLFAAILKKAIILVKGMAERAYEKLEKESQSTGPVSQVEARQSETAKTVKPKRIPPKPQKPSSVDDYEHLKEIFDKIKRYGGKIRANESKIEALEIAATSCTSIFQRREKRQYEKEIQSLKSANENLHGKQEDTIQVFGYTDVDSFMKLYWNTKNAKEAYERKVDAWLKKYGEFEERTIESRMSDYKKQVEMDKAKGQNNTRKRKMKIEK